MEGTVLVHHGIKGQKWGVRRFQNYDGTLTAEGKRRYSSKDFGALRDDISKRSSDTLRAFEKQPIDISKVKERGNLTDAEANTCSKLAVSVYNKAAKAEPQITNDISESGMKLYGLEHRLKQPTSLAAKIGSDAKEKELSFDEASRGIKDAIRYTIISQDDNFVGNYNSLKQQLIDKGYSELTCKNYFEEYKAGNVKHKSVQSVFKDPNGERFEVQFQTPSSQAAKELKIPLYNERRTAGLSDERKNYLEGEMTKLAEQVSYPKGIESIKSHN